MNLFLMRHADAVDNTNFLDVERPLSSKGRLQAIQTANFLQTHMIECAIISSVKRALDTYKILSSHFAIANVHISDKLYKKSESQIAQEICEWGGGAQNLLVLGHNPSISILAKRFLNTSKCTFSLKEEYLSTAGVVLVNFIKMSQWSDFTILNEGVVKEIFVPKIWS